ncbi:3,4-dihydroxy-2-butanone 4-phosphate synthase [Humidesulfovibrio mexicanus]|uniref:3,4-dihydroxy-2-butanone 4-phosphate synthase n=1 Tax=Humidesulfovibrio mexicanus TaxID=147047 RepID=A0A238YZY4_9BACT|nr:3,4-dihydroxy-2-butanone-4-phosphate synthase [Humidesulfovibrio mexicanus]SNR76213.1 3,4-dihydroxy-2-butanone 4-phosphate synthase [Humidesulfovibrio mexicanus]
MNQSLLDRFGTPETRIDRALEHLRAGGGMLVVDDEDRENEGDLIFPAQTVTREQMALLIRECSGIVCLCLTDEKADALELPPMVAHNTSRNKTAFTVTIEAAQGVTTGVSAADRVTTVRAAVAPEARPHDLHRPGHVFPLRAKPGGVLERQGHTEATVDLMRLAGLDPAGVLCELTNRDGGMARLPEITLFAEEHGLPVLAVADLVRYRQAVGV